MKGSMQITLKKEKSTSKPPSPSTTSSMHLILTKKKKKERKNEIVPFAATWMDREIIILSEVSQKKKDKYCILTYIYGI